MILFSFKIKKHIVINVNCLFITKACVALHIDLGSTAKLCAVRLKFSVREKKNVCLKPRTERSVTSYSIGTANLFMRT